MGKTVSIFFGGHMDNWITLLGCFLLGYSSCLFVMYLTNIGNSLLMMKQAICDSLLLITQMSRRTEEFNEFKYFSMRKAKKPEDEIQMQQRFDTMEMNSIQNILIRNLINNIPKRYSAVYDFHDWNSAIRYLEMERK